MLHSCSGDTRLNVLLHTQKEPPVAVAPEQRQQVEEEKEDQENQEKPTEAVCTFDFNSRANCNNNKTLQRGSRKARKKKGSSGKQKQQGVQSRKGGLATTGEGDSDINNEADADVTGGDSLARSRSRRVDGGVFYGEENGSDALSSDEESDARDDYVVSGDSEGEGESASEEEVEGFFAGEVDGASEEEEKNTCGVGDGKETSLSTGQSDKDEYSEEEERSVLVTNGSLITKGKGKKERDD